jgi:hypothetical protein
MIFSQWSWSSLFVLFVFANSPIVKVYLEAYKLYLSCIWGHFADMQRTTKHLWACMHIPSWWEHLVTPSFYFSSHTVNMCPIHYLVSNYPEFCTLIMWTLSKGLKCCLHKYSYANEGCDMSCGEDMCMRYTSISYVIYCPLRILL